MRNPISIYHKPVGYVVGLLLIMLTACKKYITVDTPDTNIGIEAAFRSNTAAAQVLTGIYSEMASNINNGTLVSTGVLPELSADNLTLFNPSETPRLLDYYRNALEPTYLRSGSADTYWGRCYALVIRTNIAVAKLAGNKYLNSKTQQRLLGEAHFMRAFLFFYLVNFYKEVPLVLTENYEQNRRLGKSSSSEIYNQIRSDLSAAEALLDNTYTTPEGITTTTNRLRPNKAAVNALQSRVELYLKDYAAAESAADKVLAQSQYSLAELDEVFKANSSETIWGLQPVTVGRNTDLANLFLLPESGPNTWENPVYASQSLLNSFLPGDARRTAWFGSVSNGSNTYVYPAKYKRGFIADNKEIQEYTIVLRVAELFLIRAEARNELGNRAGAISDINAIRHRSRISDGSVPNPLPALSENLTTEQLRPIILQERRVELFTEWGHRWFDLRRSGTIDQVMAEEEKEKGGTWASYKAYYPIPQDDIDANSNLLQTPGYSK